MSESDDLVKRLRFEAKVHERLLNDAADMIEQQQKLLSMHRQAMIERRLESKGCRHD